MQTWQSILIRSVLGIIDLCTERAYVCSKALYLKCSKQYLQLSLRLCSIGSLSLMLLFISSCATQPAPEPLHTSASYYNYLQPSFDDYQQQTERWLGQHRRFISENNQQELQMNMPFMLSPESAADTAVLLVHGLADSPYTYSDIASDLREQGVTVQVLLLPGHGSKPEDLLLPKYQDWQSVVDHYANLLKQQYQHVWLGGFSTGANLVTVHAIQQGGVDGLILFSPAYQDSVSFTEVVAPWVAKVFEWGWRGEENNLAKYSSATLNGFVAYIGSAVAAREALAQQPLDIPALVFISEADSVIDATAIAKIFHQRFTHADSQLVWYGEQLPDYADARMQQLSMQLPQQRISSASHMSITFAPSNPYYGANGQKKLCDYRLDAAQKAQCQRGENTWYAAWGHQQDDRIYSRLTWNPYYPEMLGTMQQFMGQTEAIDVRESQTAAVQNPAH